MSKSDAVNTYSNVFMDEPIPFTTPPGESAYVQWLEDGVLIHFSSHEDLTGVQLDGLNELWSEALDEDEELTHISFHALPDDEVERVEA